MKLAAYCALTAATCGLFIGCGPENQGVEKQQRIERRVGEDSNLGAADLAAATDEMVASIAQVQAIRNAEGNVTIVMDAIDNKTSMPSQDYEVFLARLRAMLNQSAVRKHLVFVETRGTAEQIKQREGYPVERSARQLPDYALSGSAYDLRRGGSAYYLLTFQLIDLRNDIITWQDSYEVKL